MLYTAKIKNQRGGVVMYCKFNAAQTDKAKKAAKAVVTAMKNAGLLKKDEEYEIEPKSWPLGSSEQPVELDPETFLPYESIEDIEDDDDEDDEEENW